MENGKIFRDSDGLFSLVSFAEACDGRIISLGGAVLAEIRITEVVIDSRSVKGGELFVALQGSKTDGEAYAADAFKHGAVCVMCRRGGAERIGIDGIYLEVDDPLSALVRAASYARRENDWRVVAVTGSVGKTTVKELCIKVLSERYPTDGTRGNYNNILGLSLSILNAFGVDKMRELHGKSQEKRKKHLVLEMGISRVGEMDRLASVALPDVAVITNIGSMHAEFLGGRAGIAAEKARVAAHGNCGVICPRDEGLLSELSRFVPKERVTVVDRSCERDSTVDCFGYKVCNISGEEGDGGFEISFPASSLKSNYDEELRRFTAPIVGKHGVTDSALAAVLGLEMGLDAYDIARGLEGYTPVSMRQQVLFLGDTVRVVDCYNCGPESVRAALEATAEYARRYGCRRRVAVLGDMLELGEGADGEHFRLGAELSEYGVALLFTVGRLAELIAEGAVQSGFDCSRVFCFGTDAEAEAIKKSVESKLLAGDIILYKASRGIGLERLVPNAAEE